MYLGNNMDIMGLSSFVFVCEMESKERFKLQVKKQKEEKIETLEKS